MIFIISIVTSVEPLLRGYPNKRLPPLERSLNNVNLDINVLIPSYTPYKRPLLLKMVLLTIQNKSLIVELGCPFII